MQIFILLRNRTHDKSGYHIFTREAQKSEHSSWWSPRVQGGGFWHVEALQRRSRHRILSRSRDKRVLSPWVDDESYRCKGGRVQLWDCAVVTSEWEMCVRFPLNHVTRRRVQPFGLVDDWEDQARRAQGSHWSKIARA